MTTFIKLTSLIINTKHIHSIVMKPNKYCINVLGNKFSGFNYSLAGFGGGIISSDNCEIEVCEIKDSKDYKAISDWIDNC